VLAAQQLKQAMSSLGMRGVEIGTRTEEMDLDDPAFDPFWTTAQELRAPIFIHPAGTTLGKRVAKYYLGNLIGNPLDTTIALTNLIFGGVLERFPMLNVVAAHGGGYLPSYAPRSDHACFVSPDQCDPNIKLKKKPTEYLNQLYFDSLVFTPEGLRHLVAQVGASQIMIGSDHPIPWQQRPVDHIFATTTLSDRDKAAILGGNAARLFGMKT
jgi:predicted TIM-barrel fold metal-dependent hydrolase